MWRKKTISIHVEIGIFRSIAFRICQNNNKMRAADIKKS